MQATCVLGDARGDAPHDAVTDALKSVRLFVAYLQLQRDPRALAAMQQRLLATTVAPSFAVRFPEYEGCCMGNRKTCKCGAPFFG